MGDSTPTKSAERLRTTCVRAGQIEGDGAPLAPPIVTASTFGFTDSAAIEHYYATEQGHVYSRYGNPTVEAAERALAALEGADQAVLFGSGMAAISTLFLAMAQSGDRIVVQRGTYGGTVSLLEEVMPGLGVRVDWIDLNRLARLEPSDIDGAALLYLESPVNPILRIVDLERVGAVARRAGVPTAVDGTFAPPVMQRPIDLGIDLVVHSVTKYLSGHSDVTGGAVSGNAPWIERLRTRRKLLGGILDPFAAYLLHRGMRTLAVRMEAHERNAMAVAEALQRHPNVIETFYPGLPGSERDLAQRQMQGFGGMVAFRVAGGGDAATRVHDRLELFVKAGSLGGVESLVSLPRQMSHRAVAPEERAAIGVTDDLVRLSVGLEDAADLIDDLNRALNAAVDD